MYLSISLSLSLSDSLGSSSCIKKKKKKPLQKAKLSNTFNIVQELCESRGGRPGLSVLTSLMVSVDVKLN